MSLLARTSSLEREPGKAYVFDGPLAGNIQAADASAILIGEVAQDVFGISVSGVDDFNGDGFDDVIIGAWDNGGGGESAPGGPTPFLVRSQEQSRQPRLISLSREAPAISWGFPSLEVTLMGMAWVI